MTYLPFFLHSSLGIQLVLSTALNQKQTLAQGTRIPEDKEGTNNLHQSRKPLGQVFRDSILHICSLQETGRKGQVCLFRNSKGVLWTCSHSTEKREQGIKRRPIQDNPPKRDQQGHIYSSECYFLPSHSACTEWQLQPARSLCQHLQVWVCGYVKGKQERESRWKMWVFIFFHWAFCLFVFFTFSAFFLYAFSLLQRRNLSVLIPGGDS